MAAKVVLFFDKRTKVTKIICSYVLISKIYCTFAADFQDYTLLIYRKNG